MRAPGDRHQRNERAAESEETDDPPHLELPLNLPSNQICSRKPNANSFRGDITLRASD
jgi:hypothetical protein